MKARRDRADASSMCGDRIGPVLEAPVSWRGRDCVVRGVDPMSVPDRRVELEDVDTGERFRIGLDELCEPPPKAA